AAALAYRCISKGGQFRVVAFVVDKEFKKEDTFFHCPVVDNESVERLYPPAKVDAFVAVGYSGLNELRAQKFKWFKTRGYKLISYVHPSTLCDTDRIGENCFIQEGCIIQAFVEIGNNV